MAEPEYFLLPYVNETDIGRVLLEDITDPSHRGRWKHLARTNPELAREILKQAMSDAREMSLEKGSEGDQERDFMHIEINLATRVLQLVGSAYARGLEEGTPPPS